MEKKSAVYKIPEDVKQEYLKHGGSILDKWILQNVRCPLCGGKIKTSACDSWGSYDFPFNLFKGSLELLFPKAPAHNNCLVHCGNCDKQFKFIYSYQKYPNSPTSFELKGEFKPLLGIK